MYNREVTPSLVQHLRETKKITMLIGARQTGKTTLMKQCIQTLEKEGRITTFLSMEQITLREKIDANPEYILSLLPITDARILLCIDEVQYLANPSNFLKLLVDLYSDKVQLFVTGSSSFYIDHRFIDSLAGRKKIFTIYPLSFREFLHFRQYDDVIQYLRKPLPDHLQGSIESLRHEYITYGSYPELVLLANEGQKKEYLKDLIGTYIYKDIYEAGIKMPSKYMDIMKLLAGQTGKLVNMNEISSLIGISTTAVQSYLYIMQKSFHIGLIRPFAKNIRKEITKMPKVYFFDLGIRNILLNDFRYFDDRQDKGEILENRFFQIFSHNYRTDEIQFWHNKQDQEVDFIINQEQAIEIKVQKHRFKTSDYNTFIKQYPHIALSCQDKDDCIIL